MDVRHLRYALALAEHQHFGRAAAAVGIAQPPLSKQIAALERDIGTRLFDRTPHGVFPTAAGEAFLARARRVLDELSGAADDARRAARGETGRLRLGFIGSALVELLPEVLCRFSAERPGVQLHLDEMSTAHGVRALLRGELDVVVSRGAPRGAGVEALVSAPVGRDHLVALVAATDPFAGQPYLDMEQLAGRPLVLAPQDEEPATLARLRTLLTGPGGLPAPVTYARDIHTIMGLAACGVGVGLGPSCVRPLARPDIRICDIRPRVELPDLVLSCHADDRSPVLRAFLETVREVCPGARPVLDRCLARP
ncbi:LysR family transcriptional regulator [Streptomyces sp. IMTB 2501]|uniref:LysR family transcriptional regulator n=1 Tax=Streptomyces sp. IMTB 2501 TaxID=1776340 RepID=UPI00096EF756|nr:LysR family transcriptional regulator [Streptomyces sp. IMTB 2501]OLZ60615.1 LysR family transcriptional regulator [Streptomyces sp. IMTB 2501]